MAANWASYWWNKKPRPNWQFLERKEKALGSTIFRLQCKCLTIRRMAKIPQRKPINLLECLDGEPRTA